MTELDLFRMKINELDTQLVNLLKERIKISTQIGEYKKKVNLPIFDAQREKEVIDFFTKNETINKKHIEKFLLTLMEISKEVQS